MVADPGTQMLTYTPAKDDHDTYTFMYTARDDDPVRMLTSPAARVTVTVNAVNDAPEFATEMTTRTVSEGARPGDTVGTKVAATDVDDITLTYSLAGASDFVIDASGPTAGQIRVAPDVTLDRELTSSYEVTVTASDRLNESDSITVTITLDNVNDPPVAANDTATTAEDKEVIIRVLDNDTDPDTERANLRVSVGTQPLNGRARVESDAGSVTVTVEAVNDAPVFPPSETGARSVPESAKAGANAGAPVTATDVDNAMLTYSLSGADSGSFNIDADSGQITVTTGVTFDIAERQATYMVTIGRDPGRQLHLHRVRRLSQRRRNSTAATTGPRVSGPTARPSGRPGRRRRYDRASGERLSEPSSRSPRRIARPAASGRRRDRLGLRQRPRAPLRLPPGGRGAARGARVRARRGQQRCARHLVGRGDDVGAGRPCGQALRLRPREQANCSPSTPSTPPTATPTASGPTA